MKRCLLQIISVCLLGWASLLTASTLPGVERFEKTIPHLGSWQLELHGNQVKILCNVAENCYLFSDETFVTLYFANQPPIKLPQPPAQESEDKTYRCFKTGTHYWQSSFKQRPVRVTVNYQGCTTGGADGAMCLMPESFEWDCNKVNPQPVPAAKNDPALPENLQKALARFSSQRAISGLQDAQGIIDFIGNTPAARGSLTDNSPEKMSFWAILLLVVIGGLGLNLTPCVLPMIPKNLAIIGASGAGVSRWQGFRRGGAYALGITLTYGILGVLAAVTGSQFGSLNSSSIFNWVIALIFLALALGMLGVYEIDFTRLSNLSRRNGGKKRQLPPTLSAFLLGVMAALLAGACVAPVVITVVLLAGKLYSQGAVWGLFLPFALGFSMALPWPLLGAGLSCLPKPGAWMVRIKQLFGVIILLMAVYYTYIGIRLFRNEAVLQSEITALAGNLERAADSNQTVLIDCWATWCKNCTAQERVLQSPEVQNVLQKHNVKVIRFQAENLNDPAVKAFMQKYQLPGLPSMVLLKK